LNIWSLPDGWSAPEMNIWSIPDGGLYSLTAVSKMNIWSIPDGWSAPEMNIWSIPDGGLYCAKLIFGLYQMVGQHQK
jgi:hypothetical protein